MFDTWSQNVETNLQIIEENKGPSFVIAVSGSEGDQRYWQTKFQQRAHEIFRRNGDTYVHSALEKDRKGNFLGTFNAWKDAIESMKAGPSQLPNVTLMSMVFGQGKRLSPFTQAMGNRKSALLTPAASADGDGYLSVADLSNRYVNLWVRHLDDSGFRGLIVKWGDEAVIPGVTWGNTSNRFGDVDAVRFVWQTEITEELAREKDWVIIDAQSGLMRFQLSRQEIGALQARIGHLGGGSYNFGVNLGSLAISYDFLDVATKILKEDIADPGKRADWDPYAWIALTCKDEAKWKEEAEIEHRLGESGIAELESRYPDFYQKISQVRTALEARTGRPLSIGVVDFGQAYWIDMGLHLSLRKNMSSLVTPSGIKNIARRFFDIPVKQDDRGNTLFRSSVPRSTDINDSVLIDTIIKDPDSVVKQGLIVGGRHSYVSMPHGGAALFCAVNHLSFVGNHAIAYRSLAPRLELAAGGRHTTLLLPDGPQSMISNESVIDYKGQNFREPILGNPISFQVASELVSRTDGQSLDRAWRALWKKAPPFEG